MIPPIDPKLLPPQNWCTPWTWLPQVMTKQQKLAASALRVPTGNAQVYVFEVHERRIQLETIFKSLHFGMSLKRKLPESLTAGSKRATSPPPESLVAAIEAETQASNAPKTPPREIQSGCPASNFLLTVSPQQYKPIALENLLQCDLAATPKEQWCKR